MGVKNPPTKQSHDSANDVRRGARHRYPPLAYWRNERVFAGQSVPSRRTVTLSQPSHQARKPIEKRMGRSPSKRTPTPGPQVARQVLRLEEIDVKEEEQEADELEDEEVDELEDELEEDGEGSEGGSSVQTPRRPTSPILSDSHDVNVHTRVASWHNSRRQPHLPRPAITTVTVKATKAVILATRQVQPEPVVKKEEENQVVLPEKEEDKDDVKLASSSAVGAGSSSKKVVEKAPAVDRKGKRKLSDGDAESDELDTARPSKKLRADKPATTKDAPDADRKGKRKVIDPEPEAEEEDPEPVRPTKKTRTTKQPPPIQPSLPLPSPIRTRRTQEPVPVVTPLPTRPSVKATKVGGLPTPESPMVSASRRATAGSGTNTQSLSASGSSKAPQTGSSTTSYEPRYVDDADEDEDEDGILRYSPAPVRRIRPLPKLAIVPNRPAPLREVVAADKSQVVVAPQPSPPPTILREVSIPVPPRPQTVDSVSAISQLPSAIAPAPAPPPAPRSPTPIVPPSQATPVLLAWLRPLRLEHRAEVFARLGLTALWQVQQLKGLREANRETFFASFLSSGGTLLELVVLKDAIEGLRAEPYYEG